MNSSPTITRCPGCGTAFRASESQLAARAGQVRCGRCDTVFDAHAQALPMNTPAIPESADDPVPSGSPEPQPVQEALVLTPAPAHDPLPMDADALMEGTQDQVAPGNSTDSNLDLDFEYSKQPAGAISPWIAWPALAMLVIMLAAQIVYQFRGDIALIFPEAKPYVESLCADLGCDLPLPRRAAPN